MRGKIAKQLRKQVYGDMSLRGEREYAVSWFKRLLGKTDDKGKPAFVMVGTAKAKGLRREYREAKKVYKARTLR